MGFEPRTSVAIATAPLTEPQSLPSNLPCLITNLYELSTFIHHSLRAYHVNTPISINLPCLYINLYEFTMFILQSLWTFQVIEILQTSSATDLFSPELQKERSKKADPVANDLLGALLSVWSCHLTNVIDYLWPLVYIVFQILYFKLGNDINICVCASCFLFQISVYWPMVCHLRCQHRCL